MGARWDDLNVVAVAGSPGRFTATISDDWMLLVAPQGGIVAAIAARAMAAVLGSTDQTLRTLSVVFAGQVGAGPVEIDVTVLRTGRSMSQLSASVRNPGKAAGLTATGVFGAPRRGFEFTELAYPEVPGPDGLWAFGDPVPDGYDFEFPAERFPFWDAFEGRPALGRYPWEPVAEGPAEGAVWNLPAEPPVGPDGLLDPAVTIVLCDLMPGAVSRRVATQPGAWFSPAADFTIHLFGSAPPGWLLAHNRARHAGDGYASVDMALWEPTERRLLAYATQILFFSFQD